MNLQMIQDNIPTYAKDIKLNFSSLMSSETILTEQQFWGTLLATAIVCKNGELLQAINIEAKNKLTENAYSAAQSAAALMAMNNIYYRFTHLVGDSEYARLPANLRMNTLNTHGIEKLDFELFSLAVSAIHGCGLCIESHEKALRKHGASKEVIQAAIRIAAIIHATSLVFSVKII